MSFTGSALMSGAADTGQFAILVDGAQFPASGFQNSYFQDFALNDIIPISLYAEIPLSAGSHTFNIAYATSAFGQLSFSSAGGNTIALTLEVVAK